MNFVPLHVQTAGTGFPILCLHGHPGSGASLSVFTHHLCRRFYTMAPDLRGYGQSQVSGDFTMNDHLLDLEALLDRYSIQGCVILGWSLGGILAMELALKLPERVKGLILIATAARPRSSHPPITWEDNFYTGVASILNWFNPGWQWNIQHFGGRSLYRYLLSQHTSQAYRHLAQEGLPAYLQTSRSAQRALAAALKSDYNRLEALTQINCPSLVLAAEGDRHITPDSSLETARALAHSDWICYPRTAHLLPWEIPTQILSDIDHWLDRQQGQIGLDQVLI